MPKTLLLADDSVTIQKVVGISFANEDVVLLTVDNGDDAVVRAKEARPDLVLADVAMPGKDGYEVCEAIKADPELRHVPVLLLSGTFESFDEDRARHVGADGHITKPFEAQALVDRVNELLAHAESARPAGASDTTVLVSEVPASSGDAFDFFDEEFATTSPSLSPPPAATTLLDDVPPAPAPIELEAVGDDLAEAPEAVAIASFDEDEVDPPSGDGQSTVLFDAPPPIPTRAPSHAGPAATQLLDDAAEAVPAEEAASGFDDAFDFGFDDEPEASDVRPVEPIAMPARDTAATERAFDAPHDDAADDLFEAELDEPSAPIAPPPVPASAAPQRAADVAVASGAHVEVLRQELHQHLEKVAWEAFGDLSERIVREAVGRIEAIAWEVIPQMAETLIREEIRKLQDGD